MPKLKPERQNLWIDWHRERCDFCGVCVAVCPPDVILLTEVDLVIDHDGCTRCMNCVNDCPFEAFNLQRAAKEAISDQRSAVSPKGIGVWECGSMGVLP